MGKAAATVVAQRISGKSPAPAPSPSPSPSPSAAPAPAPAPSPSPSRSNRRFFDADSLLDSVEGGAIALLSGRYLITLHQRGGQLQRRQDLPPEAFFSIKKLRRLVAALGQEWGRLFVAISYRWLTADHPDPDGFHLAIIARVAELYLKPEHMHGHRSPLVEAFETMGESRADFGVMWDFGSLFQKPRTGTQTELFKQGLGTLPMWYGHVETTIWMQPDLPDGFGERMLQLDLAQTYDTSGWCYVESSMSAGIKRGDRRLNLGLRTERALSQAYGGDAWTPEYRLDFVCTARRPPPMAPEAVAEELRNGGKKFTSNADVEVVAELYRSYFEGISSTATHLDFAGLRWADPEVTQLAAVLPRFTSAARLDLAENLVGPDGAAALAPALADSLLTSVNVLCNQLDRKSAKMLAAVAKQKGFSLCGIEPEDTTANFESHSLTPADAILLASDLSQARVTGSLTKLL